MNPKSATFLSATLTAFVMSVLFAVVTKISTAPKQAEQASQAQAQATVTMPTESAPTEIPTAIPTVIYLPTPMPPLGPEEAAILAAESINREDLYSVEATTFNGAESYKVVFSSGDIVYIGMNRVVQNITKLAPVIVSVPSTAAGNGQNISAGKKKNNEQINNDNSSNDDANNDDDDDDDDDDEDND